MVTLETERLILRPFRSDDFPVYAEMAADPETMRFIGLNKTMGTTEAWRSLAALAGHWVLRGYGMWALEEKSTGEFVGRAGIFHPEGWPELEVGWTIRRSRWGRGYATEAGLRAMQWAFRELNLDIIHSVIDPLNVASIRVAEKLGETLRYQTEVNGHPVSLYGITREEFIARNEPLL